jgi:hypothetical protein
MVLRLFKAIRVDGPWWKTLPQQGCRRAAEFRNNPSVEAAKIEIANPSQNIDIPIH